MRRPYLYKPGIHLCNTRFRYRVFLSHFPHIPHVSYWEETGLIFTKLLPPEYLPSNIGWLRGYESWLCSWLQINMVDFSQSHNFKISTLHSTKKWFSASSNKAKNRKEKFGHLCLPTCTRNEPASWALRAGSPGAPGSPLLNMPAVSLTPQTVASASGPEKEKEPSPGSEKTSFLFLC